jgi:acyl carrier protein
MADLRARVRALLAEQADVPEADDAPLDLDSLTLVLLVEAIEAELGVHVAARQVTPANFGTISAIVAFLQGIP